jgi:hypothetical protein
MPLSVATLPVSSTEPYRYEELGSFTGGLNLRADQFNLGEGESPALLNVSVDPRGGVERRDSIDALNSTALPNSIIALGSHSETPVGGGADQILAACLSSGGSTVELHYSTGGNFADMELSSATATLTGTTAPFFVTFNDFTYIGNGALFSTSYSTVKWSGANDITRLTPDIDGSDGHFPTARYATTWGERVWVAYTVESTTTYANRIRFSKINDAENWTATDYIDIDIGEHGDRITGIVADGDRLLIFKQNAVYALYGFDTDSFQVQNITRVVGSVDGCLPISTPYGVFFWYAQEGLYLLSRDSLDYIFQRLYPSISPLGALTLTTQPSIMWFDERLWLSVDYQSGDGKAGSAQANRRNVFVWDPSLGQAGAWTRYDINARSLFSYSPPGGTHLGLGVTSDWSGTAAFTRVSKFEQSADTDDYTGSGASEIFSHYQTRWLSGNRPTFPKRWGKTRTVMLAENTVTVGYTVYKDYSLASGTIIDSKAIEGEGSTSVWDTATWVNDAGTDGNGTWSSEGLSKVYKFFRWPTAGTARAISVRFSVNPTTGARGKWGMTSLVGMYRTRRIR